MSSARARIRPIPRNAPHRELKRSNGGVGRGRLLVFEAPDGMGKTTVAERLVAGLREAGIAAEDMHFPGRTGGTLGSHVYRLHHEFKAMGISSIHPTSLQVLHVAAHVDAIRSRILPALRSGRWIILDRFWWSTLVYGVVGGVDRDSLERLIKVEELQWGNVRPAALFLVRRKPMRGRLTRRQAQMLWRGYLNLARGEGKKYPVWLVENRSSVEETV